MPGYQVNHQCDFTEMIDSHVIYTTQLTERVIPMDGEMTFDGNATDIMDSLRILLGGTTVRMHVSWSVAE